MNHLELKALSYKFQPRTHLENKQYTFNFFFCLFINIQSMSTNNATLCLLLCGEQLIWGPLYIFSKYSDKIFKSHKPLQRIILLMPNISIVCVCKCGTCFISNIFLNKRRRGLRDGLLDGMKNGFDEFARLMAYSYSTLMFKGSKIIVF